jgi:hypothetical protein
MLLVEKKIFFIMCKTFIKIMTYKIIMNYNYLLWPVTDLKFFI